MDFSENLTETVKASKEADYAYASWYASQPDEKKAAMIVSGWQLVAGHVQNQAKKENPFVTKAEVMMKFIEHTQKAGYPADIFAFIRQKMAERSEVEWIQRFKAMKKKLGWTYDDMAKFMGAKSGASVKVSVNRKLPAFAKLAVCVFEELSGR